MAKKKQQKSKSNEKVKEILKEATSSKKKGKEEKSPKLIEKEEFDKLESQLLRTVADMENLRKRTEKEMGEARKFAISGFALDLLETLDNLERAQQNIPEDEIEKNESLKNISEVIKMTAEGLMATLEKQGKAY